MGTMRYREAVEGREVGKEGDEVLMLLRGSDVREFLVDIDSLRHLYAENRIHNTQEKTMVN